MTYRTNLAAGSVLSLFAVCYLYFSFGIKPFEGIGATPLDAAFIPRLWGVCLLALSLSLVVRGIRARNAASGKGREMLREGFSPREFFRKNREVVLTFVSIGVYTALLGPVGFVVASSLYIFFQIIILSPPGERNYKIAAIIAVVSSVAVDYLFVVLLSVLLPTGILGF